MLLLPWLLALDKAASWPRALGLGILMAMAFTAAVFPWFGEAIGQATQWGSAAGVALLVLAGPLFQPQFLVYALLRWWFRRTLGPVLAALAGACAWVATETLAPKLLGDTLGHGLYPSVLLRQAADLGGAAGLTLLLLLVHEALLAAWRARRQGLAAVARPLAAAAAVPLALAAYGLATPNAQVAAGTPTLRVAMVQSAIVDYERLRREKGTAAVVREVLDVHYAMTHDAVERQQAQAVLWSETVYPTTFAQPKSQAGAELDREIVGIVNAAGVPFVFGTYDRDGAGEYNAAAFVAPGRGLVGFYRKTHPFPLTEWVPSWLDSPGLRQALPWLGSWRPGNGARVLPLFLADGREVPVLPLICLDAVHPSLALDGARLGAQVILSLSNDSWFTNAPQGAALHLVVAAFRSIETRLPQFRVTSNGTSAVIDVDGTVLASTRMGERTLVLGNLPVRQPPGTLMVSWGDWVGHTAAALLLALGLGGLWKAWASRHPSPPVLADDLPALPWRVALPPPWARWAVTALRALSRGSLLWMAAGTLAGAAVWQSGSLAPLRNAALLWGAPEGAAWCLLLAFGARLSLDGGALVFSRGTKQLRWPVADVVALRPWQLPLPGAGVELQRTDGARLQLLGVDASALGALLATQGHRVPSADAGWSALYTQVKRTAPRAVLRHPLLLYVALPLMLAVPAFRLHQVIAFGSPFGEWQAFGGWAFARGFALWWAAWALGVLVCATVLRTAIEAGCAAAARWQPLRAAAARRGSEAAGLVLLYAGLPAWLAWRALG